MKAKHIFLSIFSSLLVAQTNIALAQNQITDIQIDSPLADSVDNLPGLLLAILNVFITLSIPIIVIAIVYSGFMYVTARGNPQTIKTATKSLTYAVIGAVLIIGALVITEIIGETITSFGAT